MSLEQQIIINGFKSSMMPNRKKTTKKVLGKTGEEAQLQEMRRHSLTRNFNQQRQKFQGLEEIPIEGFGQLMRSYQNQKPNNKKNFIAVFDGLFKEQLTALEKRDMEQLRQTKYYKTLIQERMEEVEKQLSEEQQIIMREQMFREVTELKNKAHTFDKQKAQLDVLQGRYNLKINKRLPYNRKIEKFAQEPIAYYLHKKNDFIKRINKAYNNTDQVEDYKFQQTIQSILQTKNLHHTIENYEAEEQMKMENMMKQEAAPEDKNHSPDTQKKLSQQQQQLKHKSNFKQNLKYFQQIRQSNVMNDEIMKALADRQDDTKSSNTLTLHQLLKLKFEELDRKRINQMAAASKSKDENKLYDKDLLLKLALNKVKDDQLKVSLDLKRINQKRDKLINTRNRKYTNKAYHSLNYQSKKSIDGSYSQSSQEDYGRQHQTMDMSNADMDEVTIIESPERERAKTHMAKIRNSFYNSGYKAKHNQTCMGSNNFWKTQTQFNNSQAEQRTLDSQIFHEKLLLNQAMNKYNALVTKYPGDESSMNKTFHTTIRQPSMRYFNNSKDLQQKRAIEAIMRQCYSQNKETKISFQQISDLIDKYKLKDHQFHQVSTQLKELEGVDSSVIAQIYEYKMGEKNDDEAEAQKITKDYKMNYLDPSKYIATLKNEKQWTNASKQKQVNNVKYK